MLKLSWTVVAMGVAMVAVGGLAYWDATRDAEAALEDFGEGQAVVARSAIGTLGARLAAVRSDAQLIAEGLAPPAVLERYSNVQVTPAGSEAPPPAPPPRGFRFVLAQPSGKTVGLSLGAGELFDGLAHVEHPGSLMLLVQAPGETGLRATDGRTLEDAGALTDAMAKGRTVLRLTRPQAAQIGLPERMAAAGFAGLDAGALGHWNVGVVSSALRERDRQRRDAWRLVLSVLLAGGLVLAFGGVALRQQRRQLELARDLEVAKISREGDERLERLGKMATLVTLASGVAHEVSTPLGVIVGRAEQVLPRVKDDERATHAIQVILDQAERISQVVRGFLTLAREGSPTVSRVSPVTLVNEALALVQHRYEKAGVVLTSTVPPQLPAVGGDARLLEHALVNLLLNACDATPRSGHVEVSARVNDGSVTLEVTDDGVGITAANAARATEPFFTTKPVGQGTGLGLAIANEIVKSHRGSLSIESAGAKGTRASLRIPLAAEAV